VSEQSRYMMSINRGRFVIEDKSTTNMDINETAASRTETFRPLSNTLTFTRYKDRLSGHHIQNHKNVRHDDASNKNFLQHHIHTQNYEHQWLTMLSVAVILLVPVSDRQLVTTNYH